MEGPFDEEEVLEGLQEIREEIGAGSKWFSHLNS